MSIFSFLTGTSATAEKAVDGIKEWDKIGDRRDGLVRLANRVVFLKDKSIE